jgi:two-component system, sensor histidine kinase RegB
VVVAQIVTVAVVVYGMKIDLPVAPMAATILLLGVFNWVTWRRLQAKRCVTDLELLVQLSVDVLALTILLAFSGGATNPFAGMYLLPLAIAAACLPSTYTWFFALGTILCYLLLVFVSRPLFAPGEEASFMPLFVAGMWVTYTITAGMVAYFVVRIASTLRRDEQLVAAARERELCNEHIVRIGTLAAGAAHELSSPLATIAMIVDELREEPRDRAEMRMDLDAVAQQLASCRQTLSSLLEYGNRAFSTEQELLPFDACMRGCLDAFGSHRPEATVNLSVDSSGTPPRIHVDLALRQALFNLLGNAADVSPHAIDVRLSWDCEYLRIVIRDHGPGIAEGVEERLGELFFTTKERGRGNGLGLYLANTAIVRLGGTLRLGNASGGGATAEVFLPVAAMSPLDFNLKARR